jgi:large subunit ribosomal protein L15
VSPAPRRPAGGPPSEPSKRAASEKPQDAAPKRPAAEASEKGAPKSPAAAKRTPAAAKPAAAAKPPAAAKPAAAAKPESAASKRPPAAAKPAATPDAAATPAAAVEAAAKPAAPAPAAAKRTPTPRAGAPKTAAKAVPKESSAAGNGAAEWIGLHSLRPAPGSRRPRKRVGRGEGSGTGKTSGRGQKGYGSRSGAKDRARFEGGQMPIHMRMRKLRGPHKKQSMPFEPFRTHTQPVNLADLEARFEAGADVTLEALRTAGLGTRKGIPVKVLGRGDLAKGLTVHAHAFSASARERIEAAGGSCVVVEK